MPRSLAAQLVSTSERNFGAVKLNETRLEAFLGFKRREFVNPSEQQKLELVERDGKWWRADDAVFGLRIFTIIKPGLQNDPLLKKVMPGSSDPATIKPTGERSKIICSTAVLFSIISVRCSTTLGRSDPSVESGSIRDSQ